MSRLHLAIAGLGGFCIAVIVLAALVRPILPYLLVIFFLVGLFRVVTRGR